MPPRTREQAEKALGAYKRPAINFNKRDDFREFAGSGMGQNYNKMMDLQRQAPTFQQNDPRIDDLKQRRRQFNRYDKYNAGSIFGYTPQEMQEDYRFESNELRNRAKPVYNKMYPLTGGFMDIAEKGGILGAILSEIGNMSRDKGLPSMVDDSEEEVANYINNTFKPNMADVPTREEKIQALVDEEKRKIDNFETNAYSDILDDAIENQWPTVQGQMDEPFRVNEDDYYSKSKQGEMVFADVPDNIEPFFYQDHRTPFDEGREDFIRSQNEYVRPFPVVPGNVRQDVVPLPDPEIGIEFGVDNWEEPLPFNDDLREAGIASTMKSGYLAGRRPYEDEYRAFVESSGPSKVTVTYEDFMETYLPRIQESRGALREPLNSQGKR